MKIVFLLDGAKESDIVKEALSLNLNMPHEHIIQTLADLSTCIKLGNCELPIKYFKYEQMNCLKRVD